MIPDPDRPPTPANDALTRLREALYDPPSAASWRAICASLDQCPPDLLPLAVDYALQSVDRWPQAVGLNILTRRFDARFGLLPPPTSFQTHHDDLKGLSLDPRAIPERWQRALLGGDLHHPALALPTILGFDLKPTRDALHNLLACPLLRGARALFLAGRAVSGRFALELAASDALRGLTHLSFFNTDADQHGLDALCLAQGLPDLQHLALPGHRLPPTLSLSPRIKSLDLSGADLSAHPAGWADAPALDRLDLSACNLLPSALPAFLDAPLRAGLKHLTLQGNHLQEGGLRALLALPDIQSLRTLDLSHNLLNDGALRALGEGERLSNLEALIIDERPDRLTAAGRRALLALPHLGAVARERLRATWIYKHGPEILDDAPPRRSRLRRLLRPER